MIIVQQTTWPYLALMLSYTSSTFPASCIVRRFPRSLIRYERVTASLSHRKTFKTMAITTPNRCFCIPRGLRNPTQSFPRSIDQVLRDLNFVFEYTDGTPVATVSTIIANISASFSSAPGSMALLSMHLKVSLVLNPWNFPIVTLAVLVYDRYWRECMLFVSNLNHRLFEWDQIYRRNMTSIKTLLPGHIVLFFSGT